LEQGFTRSAQREPVYAAGHVQLVDVARRIHVPPLRQTLLGSAHASAIFELIMKIKKLQLKKKVINNNNNNTGTTINK
jgi:hypothetical protein